MKDKKTIIIIAAVAAVICICLCVIAVIVGAILYSQPASPTVTPTRQTVTPTSQPEPEPDSGTQTWLVMFYLDADNNLEEDMYFDLNEIESIGSTDRVTMVAQFDRSADYYNGDGNWTSTRRYLLSQDSDLEKVNSQMVADLGETDMGDSNTLADFTTWAIQTYPADRYVLIISDHGAGWPGGITDEAPLDASENWIALDELDSALGRVVADTDIPRFELVGLDACLMSMLEIYNALAPYSHYAVASEESEPGVGWAYAYFLGGLTEQPGMSGADLARAIVDGYVSQDLRIRDDAARRSMLASYGMPDKGADTLARNWSSDVTLAAVDLTALPQLNQAVDDFAYALKSADQQQVAEARSYAQSFTNVIDEAYPSAYIDLGNFADFAGTTTGSQEINGAAQDLQTALQQAVIAEKHGEQRPGATGVSVYFPVSELYWSEYLPGFSGYTSTSKRFAEQTLWDDFLAFHYAGQDFGLGNPSRDARLPAPGSGQVTIAPLELSAASIPSGGTVNLQTDITGDQVAYVYVVMLAKANCTDCYVAYSIDYIMGNESREQNGVMYPVWKRTGDAIHINLDFEPEPYAVCNGLPVSADTCAFAMVNWDKYEPNKENMMVFVEGWYVFADTGQRVEATMYLYNRPDFELRNIIGHFTDAAGHASLSNITPRPGDQFVMLDTWWKAGADGQYTTTYQEGYTLTFNDQQVFWASAYPIPGDYSVGIMVEDMDGSQTWQFAPLTITDRANP